MLALSSMHFCASADPCKIFYDTGSADSYTTRTLEEESISYQFMEACRLAQSEPWCEFYSQTDDERAV